MRNEVRSRLIIIREQRMWTQGRLAEEAGVSPTTVSGIESGRISRPHFGTIKKLARALGVAPEELFVVQEPVEANVSFPVSLEWALSAREEEFERALEDTSRGQLEALLGELREEQGRLQALYGRFSEGSEQRRSLKWRIREVAANLASLTTSLAFYEHASRDHLPGRR